MTKRYQVNEKIIDKKLAKKLGIGMIGLAGAVGAGSMANNMSKYMSSGKQTDTEHVEHVEHVDNPEINNQLDSITYELPERNSDVINQTHLDCVKSKILAAEKIKYYKASINDSITIFGKAYVNKHLDKIAKRIIDISKQYDIEENILLSIAAVESGFNHTVNYKGMFQVTKTGLDRIYQLSNEKHYNQLHKSKEFYNAHPEVKKQDSLTMKHVLDSLSKENLKLTNNIKHSATLLTDMRKQLQSKNVYSLDMLFASYNGGVKCAVELYSRYKAGWTLTKLQQYAQQNKLSSTYKHFVKETKDYANRCMKAYRTFQQIDKQYVSITSAYDQFQYNIKESFDKYIRKHLI